MAFPDYDYDLYEDFEDALGAGWTEIDTDNNLDPNNAAAKYYDSYGMLINDIGDTAGKEAAYLYYDMGEEKSALSLGFWFRTPTTADSYWGGNEKVLCCRDTDQFPYIVRMHLKCTDDVLTLYLKNNGTSSSAITISAATWYWITIKAVTNDTCTLRIYNTSQAQVGSDVTVTGENYGCRYLHIGNRETPGWDDTDLDTDFDELVIDWTDATFPLLGWETAVGASITPHVAYYIRRRAS